MHMLRSLSRDTKKCDTHVHTSFLQPPIRLKHLGELTQLVLETISQVSEQNVDKTTVNRIGLSFWMKENTPTTLCIRDLSLSAGVIQ